MLGSIVVRRATNLRYAGARGFRASASKQKGAAGHDDHEHHDHPMFEELPFKKSTIGPMVWGALFGGTGLIWGACVFQNKKHGFPQKG